MAGDLAGTQAPRIHRYDLVIEPGEGSPERSRKATLILRDQLRVEARLAGARDFDLQLATLGRNGLPAITVARVADAIVATWLRSSSSRSSREPRHLRAQAASSACTA